MAETEFLRNNQPHHHHLVGDLRHLFPRLSRPELCLINGWIEKQLRVARRAPARRLVVVPDPEDRQDFSGDVPELLGTIRHHVGQLPTGHLVMLAHWVENQLEERKTG